MRYRNASLPPSAHALVTGATLSKLKSGKGLSGLKSQLLQDPMGMADFFGDDVNVAAALGL
jgi:hypothetical protein